MWRRSTWIPVLFASFLFWGISPETKAQAPLSIARVKYKGGGDWYSSKTALNNLAQFCNTELNMRIDKSEKVVEVGSEDIFKYPYCFLTGHGNVIFSDQEVRNLRSYLIAGGFLHICDNYGMNDFIRREMKKVFPELSFVEIPFSHPIYHQYFKFPNGLPKVHEHEGNRPQGFALVYKGRMVCFYDYESDLGNGWEDAEVYNDPEPVRQQALRMGANIIQYALTAPK